MYFWMNKTIWFLVLLLCLQYSLYDVSANEKEPSQDLNIKGQHSGLYQGPYFSGLSQARVVNLTVGERKTVHLPCQVRQLASNSLSWVRNTDSTIISIDTDIVTHDKRFMIIESSNRESWVLIIRDVTTLDAGYYECQISTEPKMSRFVHLKILVPVTKIDGAPDIFAKSGSSVEITCSVTDISTSSLIWYKDGLIIPLEERDDIDVKMTTEDKQIISVLKIRNLSRHKHGIYSCRPDGLSMQNVTLHVIDAKEQGLRTNSVERVLSGVATVTVAILVVIKLII